MSRRKTPLSRAYYRHRIRRNCLLSGRKQRGRGCRDADFELDETALKTNGGLKLVGATAQTDLSRGKCLRGSEEGKEGGYQNRNGRCTRVCVDVRRLAAKLITGFGLTPRHVRSIPLPRFAAEHRLEGRGMCPPCAGTAEKR